MSLNRYDMKFILLLSSPDNLSISETLPFFWLYKIIIIMLRGHITLSENCWSCAFIESWCAKIKSVTKTNIYFNTDEIKINLDEILPEWNTYLRQVVRGTNTFNGLVMMPNSLAVSITIYVYAHTNVRR